MSHYEARVPFFYLLDAIAQTRLKRHGYDVMDLLQQAQDMGQNAELRIIINRFEQITKEVQQNRTETRELFTTLRGEMREGIQRIERQIEDHETRLRKVESTQSELSARVTMSQIIQTTFATIAAAIAAIVGAIFK